MKTKFFTIILACAAFSACKKAENPNSGSNQTNHSTENDGLLSAPKKNDCMSDLILTYEGGATKNSIPLTVTAGSTGAPAGFSVHWISKAALDANGGIWPSSGYCGASFSGNASGYFYALAANSSITVTIGDIIFDNPGASVGDGCNDGLECGTQYVFRAFAHANSSLKKGGTTQTSASTLDCGGCTYTQGYWKNHGPEDCSSGNNSNTWPVTGLTLGNSWYTDSMLCAILHTPAQGNKFMILKHQLIAAKLNVANGANDDIAATIDAADAAIINSNSANAATIAGLLELYNSGGPNGEGHCGEGGGGGGDI